ncbi:MAG: hypothetical protein CR991_11775 [Proteobacteria bacterium]|nr:MAG: hypothetical protein CR991_11775 [Pseudomonadota bacterium]
MAEFIGEKILLGLANKELARMDKLLAKKDAEITAVMEAPVKKSCLMDDLRALKRSPNLNISKDLSILEKQINDLDKLAKKDWRKLQTARNELGRRRSHLSIEIEILNWRIDSLSSSETEKGAE